MRVWDLSSGASKLTIALQSLQKAAADATSRWDDDTSQKFRETYLEPLKPKLKRALDAIHRLDGLLIRADRDVGSD